MTEFTDSEGFKMLIRGIMPGVCKEAIAKGFDGEKTGKAMNAVLKHASDMWEAIEKKAPGTYRDAHSRPGGGGGGFGGPRKNTKKPEDIVSFGKHKGMTFSALAMSEPDYVEWLIGSAQKDGDKYGDVPFYKALLASAKGGGDTQAAPAADTTIEPTPF